MLTIEEYVLLVCNFNTKKSDYELLSNIKKKMLDLLFCTNEIYTYIISLVLVFGKINKDPVPRIFCVNGDGKINIDF